MKTTLLLTRPIEQGREFAQDLPKHINCLHSPALKFEALQVSLNDIADYDALIFTSSNAVRALEKHNLEIYKSIPVFTVGNTTKAAAEEIGFKNVVSADGDLTDLSTLIDRSKYLNFLHICGEYHKKISSIKNIDTRISYKMDKTPQIEQNILGAFQKDEIDLVAFFSPRSAQHFMDLLKQHNLTGRLHGIHALCLSDSVLKCITKVGHEWRSTNAAAQPTRRAMISIITETSKGLLNK